MSGLDFTVDYTLRRGANRFDIDADGSYLLQYDRKLTPTSPSVELVDTANYPVDFRGRLAGTWTRGVFSGTVDINYLDGERDPSAPRLGSWTTVGLQAAFHSAAQSGEMKGLVLALNVFNVLDTDPPFYDSPEGVGYDATKDVAVLQLQGASGLTPIPIGDSSSVTVGAKVTALGNAGGKGGTPSVATGTVTALNQ